MSCDEKNRPPGTYHGVAPNTAISRLLKLYFDFGVVFHRAFMFSAFLDKATEFFRAILFGVCVCYTVSTCSSMCPSCHLILSLALMTVFYSHCFIYSCRAPLLAAFNLQLHNAGISGCISLQKLAVIGAQVNILNEASDAIYNIMPAYQNAISFAGTLFIGARMYN